MITFAEKRQKFLKSMRAKMQPEHSDVNSQPSVTTDDQVDDELMALLEKKFDELFGPLDDDD